MHHDSYKEKRKVPNLAQNMASGQQTRTHPKVQVPASYAYALLVLFQDMSLSARIWAVLLKMSGHINKGVLLNILQE